jgi:hypothetical protein
VARCSYGRSLIMALPASLHAQGPIRAVLLALMMSVSITMAVLACVIPNNWWPMLAMGANLVAVATWAMFQPGIGCVVSNNSSSFMDGNTGICGPPVFELWGKWLTSFFGASSFAAAVILYRTEKIDQDWAFGLTIASVCFVYLTTWYAVATADPPGGGMGASLIG